MMTVDDLRKLIADADGNMKVLVPAMMQFDGVFYSPCLGGSGISAVGTNPDLSEEDIEEMKLLSKEVPEEEVFLLIPCGFGEENECKHELN